MLARAAIALAGLAACGRAPVERCTDDLGGVWRGPAGTYHLLDRGGRLELYPTFRDLPADLPAGVRASPSVIDLTRTSGAGSPRGTITRRYERGPDLCAVKHPVTLTACGGDRLTLELVAPAPPTDWTACTDGATTVTTLILIR